MKIRSTILVLATVIATASFADEPPSQKSWIKASEGGTAIFKMIATDWDYSESEHKEIRKPHGIAYTMDEEGNLNKQWESNGWYAYEGFISDDGRYFVSLDPHTTDQANHTDIAIVFYDRGTLLKQYRVCDLIKDPSRLSDSVMYYDWLPVVRSFPDRISGHTFWLTMIDKTQYAFDVKTGAIIQSDVDSHARSFTEMCEEKEAEARRKGVMIYENSALKKRFQKHFKLVEASTDKRSSTYGIDFEEPEWCATFEPLADYGLPLKIKAIFPVMPQDIIHTKTTAVDIEMAIKETFAHPEFRKRFPQTSVIGIEMKISGNSLHMIRYQAEQQLSEKGVNLKTTPLESWAHFVVETSGRKITTIYYNISSKQIVIIEYP